MTCDHLHLDVVGIQEDRCQQSSQRLREGFYMIAAGVDAKEIALVGSREDRFTRTQEGCWLA